MRDSHLVNGPGIAETPPPSRVRLTDGIARVTASTLGRFSAIARATIPFRALFVQFVDVVPELHDLRARDSRSRRCEASLDDVVGDVTLELARYVHQVKG
jgi:hypothetical protein